MTDMEDVGASVEADVGQRMKGFVSRFAANLIVSSVLPPPTPMRTSACAHSSVTRATSFSQHSPLNRSMWQAIPVPSQSLPRRSLSDWNKNPSNSATAFFP